MRVNRPRSFAVRYLILIGGEVTSKALVFGAFAYLARVLGPRDFGIIELALSTTVLFVLGAELGLGSYGARLVEASPDAASQLVPRAGLLRLTLAVPAYLAILGLVSAQPEASRGVLAICGLTVLLTPFNTQWAFQGLRQMQWVAAGSVVRYGTFAAAIAVLVRPESDLRLVAFAEVLGAVGLALFNVAILRSVFGFRLDWRGAWAGVASLFRKAWFLGASDLTWMAMWLSPAIIVGWLGPGNTEQVAWIAAAVRIVMALHTFVWLYFFNLLPNLSRELHEGIDGWRALLRRSLAGSMGPAGLLAIGGTIAAPFAMTAVFGPAYGPAVLPFQIVIWMIPVACLSGHFRYSMIAAGRQDLEFRASAIGGLVVVGLTLGLAPRFGAAGAAAALLTGGVVNGAAAAFWLRQAIRR